MIDTGDMAVVIGDALNEPECWNACGYDFGEIYFTNEYGQKFVLTIEEVDAFPDMDGEDAE
jgi:hypothetical protein